MGSETIKSLRLGPIQKRLLVWIETSEYLTIGPSTVPPEWAGLSGLTMDEVGPSLERLKARGLVIEPKQGFYAIPGWVRPKTPEETEQSCKRVQIAVERMVRLHRENETRKSNQTLKDIQA